MNRMIDNYNQLLDERGGTGGELEDFIRKDKSRIAWVQNLIKDFEKGKQGSFDASEIVNCTYRPFTRQWLYKQRQMIWSPYRTNELFPEAQSNVSMLISGPASKKGFSVLAVDNFFNFDTLEKGYAYPQKFAPKQAAGDVLFDGPTMQSAISNWARKKFHDTYGREFSDEDIFFYVFGIMSSREFQTRFAVELRKEAPRVPLVLEPEVFVEAGRNLVKLQLAYEEIEPWPLVGLPSQGSSADSLMVEKMRFAKNAEGHSRSAIVVNKKVVLSEIPEKAYDFVLNGKSAIEIVMERYQVKTDKASGIVNDPNLYSDDPRYIVDLVARIVRVSMESVRIIDGLPKLKIIE